MLIPGSLHAIIPPSEYGNARVVVDEPDVLTRLRAARDGQPLSASKYTRLIADGTLWMTDAEFECWTQTEILKATGDILIAGLGLGLILLPLIKNRAVKSITVLERNADIIALIAPHFHHKKLTVIEADVHTWTPLKKTYDFVYFDIWPNVPNSDQKSEIQALKKRYRPSLKTGGRSVAWCERYAYKKERW